MKKLLEIIFLVLLFTPYCFADFKKIKKKAIINKPEIIFPIPQIIEYCSGFTELKPGDVIVTGTPGGVGDRREPPVYMKDGDTVEVEISSLGILKNTIVKEN